MLVLATKVFSFNGPSVAFHRKEVERQLKLVDEKELVFNTSCVVKSISMEADLIGRISKIAMKRIMVMIVLLQLSIAHLFDNNNTFGWSYWPPWY